MQDTAHTTNTHTEPTRLTRASLLGHSFRIAKVYGNSPIAVRVKLAYERALGNKSVLEFVDTNGKAPFASFQTPRIRAFSQAERARREKWAREDRQAVRS